MTSKPKRETSSADPAARLSALVSKGFKSLSLEERAEAEELIEWSVDQWKAEVAAMIRADVEARRYTKREIGRLTGYDEANVSAMSTRPRKLSGKFLAALSLTVPGYEHVYLEFRKRSDVIYLPAGFEEASPDVRLQEIARALREKLPELQGAVARLERLAAGGDGGTK